MTICHPKIIETGLDLLSHPSLIFYESGYSLHTLRQASRRSWRIGQRQPVRVYYLHYEDTVQTACLRLMGKKLLVSLAMEGKFSGEGLQALDDGDDMLTAMARELVTQRGIGDPADAVWRQIQAEQSKIVSPAAEHRGGAAGRPSSASAQRSGRCQCTEVRIAAAFPSPCPAERGTAHRCSVLVVLSSRGGSNLISRICCSDRADHGIGASPAQQDREGGQPICQLERRSVAQRDALA